MPLFDSTVPNSLLNVQKWFGAVITAPLLDDDSIQPFSPSGHPIEKEAARFIMKSPTLAPFERIQIYNQQYWWRLIGIMQEAFPLLTRLFGYEDFNKMIAIPYLTAFPPNDWSLNTLGKRLPDWISRSYQLEDKELVLNAAVFEEQFHELFFKKKEAVQEEDFAVKRLYMQPSAALLKFPYDLILFRKEMLKEEVDYWISHPFPELVKNQIHVLFYRSSLKFIKTKPISIVEWGILNQFKKGTTIDELCGWIENQSDDFRKNAEENLQKWFGEWTSLGIFCDSI